MWGKNPEFLTTPPPLSRLQVKICILQVKICILQVEICIFQVTRLSKFAPPPGSFISSAKHFFGVLLCKKVFVDLCQHLIEVNSSKNPILWGKNPKFLMKIKENQVENCKNSSKNPSLWGEKIQNF